MLVITIVVVEIQKLLSEPALRDVRADGDLPHLFSRKKIRAYRGDIDVAPIDAVFNFDVAETIEKFGCVVETGQLTAAETEGAMRVKVNGGVGVDFPARYEKLGACEAASVAGDAVFEVFLSICNCILLCLAVSSSYR
jgi:hypothetical protein